VFFGMNTQNYRERLRARLASPLTSYLALLILLALFFLPLLFLPKLNLNNTLDVYLPKEEPSVIFHQSLRETFPQDEVLIGVFHVETGLSMEFFAHLYQLTEQLEMIEDVERVLSVFHLDHVKSGADGFDVVKLVDSDELEILSVEDVRQRILNDRFAPGLLVSESGHYVAVVVRPEKLRDSRQRLMLEEHFRALVSDHQLDRYLAAVSGHVALDVAELKAMMHDTSFFTPIVIFIGLVIIWFMFRDLFATLLAGVAIGAVMNPSMALLIFFDEPYTLVTTMLGPLLSALTIALLVHYYSAIIRSEKSFDKKQNSRYKAASYVIRRPAFYTVLTTSCGLFSLYFSSIPPVETFGLIAALGMMLSYFIVIVLLPPIFFQWQKKSHWGKRKIGLYRVKKIALGFAKIGIRRARFCLVVSCCLPIVLIPFIFLVDVESDLFQFFSEDHPLNKSTKLIEKEFSGVTNLELIFQADVRDGLISLERLEAIRQAQVWAENLSAVDRAMSFIDVIEEMNWAFHGENSNFRRMPDSETLIKQYLFIYDGIDLYELVDRDFQTARVTLSVALHGANEISNLIAVLEQKLQHTDLYGLTWSISGYGKQFAVQEDLLVGGQKKVLIGALVLIFVCLIVFFRSVKVALICMIPNTMPIILIFAMMGAFGIWLDIATAMIASVTIGVAVDDTIHLYHCYNARKQRGASTVWALVRAYHEAGVAIIITTFILCLQFLVVILSDFQPTTEFGLLTFIGLVAALFCDLLILPALLVVLNARSDKMHKEVNVNA